MKFKEVQPGDIILGLEMNRRTLCPTLEVCKVLRVSKEFTDRVGNSFGRLVKIELVDSTQESYEVVLEADTEGSIYDKVFYSTSPEAVFQEVQVQKQRAQATIDNISKYKLCVEECDKIMLRLAPQDHAQAQSNMPDIDRLVQEAVNKQLAPVSEMVKTIYDSLMPSTNKPE